MEPFDTYILRRILAQVGAVIAIALILGCFIVAYNTTYTTVLSLDEQAGEGWARIVDDMGERYGRIPDLVAALGRQPGTDTAALGEVTRNLERWRGAMAREEMAGIDKATTDLEKSLGDLTGALPRGPGARGTAEVRDLLGAIGVAGEALSEDQVVYNEAVREYNMAIGSFPASLWADNWGFVRRDYFMAEIRGSELPVAQGE